MTTKGRGRPRRDPAIVDGAIELATSGVQIATISDHLGIGENTIYRRLQERRLERTPYRRTPEQNRRVGEKSWATRQAAAAESESVPASQK